MEPNYHLREPDTIPSPSLLVYRELIEGNIQRAVELVGDPLRLRPHVKTHKTREIIELEIQAGIIKHKCATLREAQLLADTGITDIVIAYPLLGPAIETFIELKRRCPDADFKPIVDHPLHVASLSDALSRNGMQSRVLLDLDVSAHRTGIPPGRAARLLYQQIADAPSLEPYGLHVYDGPVHGHSVDERAQECALVLARVNAFKHDLTQAGLEIPITVMGGTPSFPVYSQIPGVEASPGTFVLHDFNYTTWFPDLGFTPAALLFSRVISASTPGLATLDLGYKAISPDSQETRGTVWNLDGVRMGMQNEEHWIVELPHGYEATPGDVMLVCPGHVCPTVALHAELLVIDSEGQWTETWPVAARERSLV